MISSFDYLKGFVYSRFASGIGFHSHSLSEKAVGSILGSALRDRGCEDCGSKLGSWYG